MKLKNKIIALIVTDGKRDFSKTIKSILDQSRKPDEIVIASEISLKNYKEYKTFINPYEKGLARNTMQSLVRLSYENNIEKTWVATIDDDDMWKKEYLSSVEKLIDKGKNFISTGMEVRRNNEMIGSFEVPDDVSWKDFVLGNPGIQGSNKIFNLRIALESGGMSRNINAATDRTFNINLLKHPEIKYAHIKDLLCIFNKDDDRKRITNNPKRVTDLRKFYMLQSPFISSKEAVKINSRHKKLHKINKVITWK